MAWDTNKSAGDPILSDDWDAMVAVIKAKGTVTVGTFTNGDLSSGVLTLTHNKALSAPYAISVRIFDNNAKEIIPDTITGLTNTVTIDLTSYGTLTGTWGYEYVA